jgi:hypothetical protein
MAQQKQMSLNSNQDNCFFECNLAYAKLQYKLKYNKSQEDCTPWFFPSAEFSITICDPWETRDFIGFMFNDVPGLRNVYVQSPILKNFFIFNFKFLLIKLHIS